MEIFKDSSDNSNSNYDSKYNEIIYNQVNYKPNYDKINLENNKKINSSFPQFNSSFKDPEALNGNFIKSMVLLSEHKININDKYNEDGDTLLHLACSFLDFNVIRVLIEKFGADINIKNNYNKTPFYLICDTKEYYPEIISYFLKYSIIFYLIWKNY